MLLSIDNQKIRQAENLKNNWKLKEALNLLDNIDLNDDTTTHERFQFYFLKSSILIDLLSSKEAMKYAELAYNESKKLGSDYQIINVLMLKSHIFASLLEPSNQLEMINEAEEILARNSRKSSHEFKVMKGLVLSCKGGYNFSVGNLDLSLRFFSEAFQLAHEINDKKLILRTTKWLGFVYNMKGESECALEYKKRYLALAIELKDKQEIIGAQNTLGMQFTDEGEFEKAIDHLEKGLSLCYEINSWKTFILCSTLFDIYIDSNSLEKARQCFERMEALVKQGTSKFNKVIYRLSEAVLLKHEALEDSLSKAEIIFKEVADEETKFLEFKIYALVNLCDLYLFRLKKTSNLKELDNIQPYIDKIRLVAENEGVFSLDAEMHSFQAKLKLVTFEFKEAQENLVQALDIANKHNLNLLVKRIRDEQTELLKNFFKWEKFKTLGATISERMDLARVDEQIQILLQKRNYLKGISTS